MMILTVFVYILSVSSQIILEGIRGPGIEGDIAIDDVSLVEGECPDPPSNRTY